jgi:hypothetical protein
VQPAGGLLLLGNALYQDSVREWSDRHFRDLFLGTNEAPHQSRGKPAPDTLVGARPDGHEEISPLAVANAVAAPGPTAVHGGRSSSGRLRFFIGDRGAGGLPGVGQQLRSPATVAAVATTPGFLRTVPVHRTYLIARRAPGGYDQPKEHSVMQIRLDYELNHDVSQSVPTISSVRV